MTKLKIALHDGNELIEDVENYNAIEFEQKINDRETIMFAIGNSVVSKGNIKLITPVQELTE